jgi:hypothetical protein
MAVLLLVMAVTNCVLGGGKTLNAPSCSLLCIFDTYRDSSGNAYHLYHFEFRQDHTQKRLGIARLYAWFSSRFPRSAYRDNKRVHLPPADLPDGLTILRELLYQTPLRRDRTVEVTDPDGHTCSAWTYLPAFAMFYHKRSLSSLCVEERFHLGSAKSVQVLQFSAYGHNNLQQDI